MNIPFAMNLETSNILTPLWRINGKPFALPGYQYGIKQPALSIPVWRNSDIWPSAIDTCLFSVFPGASIPELADKNFDQIFLRIMQWSFSIQRAAGLPLYDQGRILRINADPNPAVLLLPGIEPKTTLEVVQWIDYWSNQIVSHLNDGKTVNNDLQEQANQLINNLRQRFPQNTNSLRFVDAANQLNIPWEYLGEGIVQFGQGCHAIRMDSSFTDKTSNIGSKIARSKLLTGALLRQAGLPGANPTLVRDIESALEIAKTLNFPVVIKPADQDAGRGVSAGLMTADEVAQAFQNAAKYSRNIVIEKHFVGRDYRLSVMNGTMLWAIERVPASVVGDGINTISELIKIVNSDPKRGPTNTTPLYPIELDDEVKRLLTSAQLTPDSIPKAGQQVMLRRIANIGQGAFPVSVTEKVHPDNKLLAERATTIIGLDIAGIDLLIPDIEISWKKSGALICEVNGQPQFGMLTAGHLYTEILQNLVYQTGRVSVTAVLGNHTSVRYITDSISKQSGKDSHTIGITNGTESVIGDTHLTGANNLYFQGNALLHQPDLNLLVLQITEEKSLISGLPCDQIDHIVITNTATEALLNSCLPHLLPACTGSLITTFDHKLLGLIHKQCTSYRVALTLEFDENKLAKTR